jgi:hypothetical protein
MKSIRTLAIAAATATLGLVGCAQTPVGGAAPHADGNHTAGMPMKMGGSGAPMENMDEQMKAMQAMHDRMMQAQTPEQRNALMAEHMKVMQESMKMMGGMGSGGMMDHSGIADMKGKPGGGAGHEGMSGMSGKGEMDSNTGMHQMMEKRMQMMQSMMQMMMDRMPAVPAKP